jgi:hypothetical protein
VVGLVNAASVRTSSGGSTTAKIGTIIVAGAAVNTGPDGQLVLKFADGQLAVMGPASTLAVSQYQFDPGNPSAGRAALDLTGGVIRIITGAIYAQNREGVSITAGASVIDILNTGAADFTVAAANKGQELGVAQVSLGEIAVSTPNGPIDRIRAGESNAWGTSNTPADSTQLATLRAMVQDAVTLPRSDLPDNAPVAVASAARAAAAGAEAKQAQIAAAANPRNAQLQTSAKAAADLAQLASQEALGANEAIAAKVILTTLDNLQPTAGSAAKNIATMLQDLPPTAAGLALAQAQAAPSQPLAPIVPTVTPGAGGGCTGSRC